MINKKFHTCKNCVNMYITATTSTTVKTQVTKPKIQVTSVQTMPPVKMEIEEASLKRKREDDDYDGS